MARRQGATCAPARTSPEAQEGLLLPPGAISGRGVVPTGTVAVPGRQRKKSALEEQMLLAIRLHGLPEPVCEYRFHASRMFRVDLAWVDERLAVEIEGGIYRGGGHTSVTGLKRDFEKGNLLTLGGWRLLRFHGDQVKSGEAVALIRQALAGQGRGEEG